jgi:hypothetical protein
LVVRFRRMTPGSTQFINRTLNTHEADEGASPSSVSHPAPLSTLKFEVAQPHQQSPHTVPRKPVVVSVAAANGTFNVLRRLSGRGAPLIAVPQDRASLLQRLRRRGGESSHR